jgi:hypothetical protein
MAYSGQIAEVVVGVSGLTGTKNQATIQPTQLLQANNITYESVTMRKEGGASKFNASAISGTPNIMGGWDWNHNGATQRSIIVATNGKIYKDAGDGSYGTELKTGLSISVTNIPVFVEGGKEAAANDRKLFIFTGSNQVQVLDADGATTGDIATPPADWSSNYPTFGFNHEGRVWGGGNSNDPHRLYYPKTTNHEDFSDEKSLSIYPGEGQGIVGALSFKGVIVCWKKPRGIYVVDTTDPTIANWKISRLSNSIGGISPMGACIVDDDIIFLDATGAFHRISDVREFGNLGTFSLSDVSDMNPFIRENFNLAKLSQVQSVFYTAKREAHFAMAGTGASVPSHRTVIDISNPQLPRFRVSARDTPVSLWLKEDSDGIPRLTSGDDSGQVWDLDTEARSFDGVGYEGRFQTPHLDLGNIDPSLSAKRKNFDFLELVVEPKGNWNLSVDVIIDGDTSETLQFNMGASGAALGSFTFDTDALGGFQILNKKKSMNGSGTRISFEGYNSGDAQDYSVAKFLLYFRPAGEEPGS